jgi:hypothetical protein
MANAMTAKRTERPLFIDFRGDGPTLKLRRDANSVPIVLTAKATGLQYIGDTMSAIFSGKAIKIKQANKRPILCKQAMSL